MGGGLERDYLVFGGLALVSFLLGWKIKRDKSVVAYLFVLAILIPVSGMIAGMWDAPSARAYRHFRRPGLDPAHIMLLITLPYVLAGFLGWLFKPGRHPGTPATRVARPFAATGAPAPASLARQTLRRVVVTVASAVISYGILSFVGLADMPSILTSVGIALAALVLG
ncbi:MAG TPA: hypothetical protein PK264_18515 [Hyphomicrobiaceae bacterium]|nr:hypothetical protein [Hyphomicrobiaceae bacterium]